jgi:hypothetical protein
MTQRQALAIKKEDIFYNFIYQIGIILEDHPEKLVKPGKLYEGKASTRVSSVSLYVSHFVLLSELLSLCLLVFISACLYIFSVFVYVPVVCLSICVSAIYLSVCLYVSQVSACLLVFLSACL